MTGSRYIILALVGLSQWLTCHGIGVDLGLCSNENVVCRCGSSESAFHIHIPIKKCTYFYRWKPNCKPCEEYDKGALCSQFKSCLACNAQRDGGCSSCPPGRYGSNCQGVCQCQNGGRCDSKTGQCNCPSEYSGSFCERKHLSTCGAPPPLRHGKLSGHTGSGVYSSVPEGTVVNYICDGGYTLVGPSRKRCESPGKWSGGEARCEYSCTVPNTKPNLKITVEPYATMATLDNPKGVKLVRRVRFTCAQGTELLGLSELNCLASSQWNGDIPKCVRSCGQPPHLQNGRHEGNSYVEGSRVHYYCNKGWMMTGDEFLTCSSGKWMGNKPACNKGTNCPAPTIQNGKVTPSTNDHTPGSHATVNCNTGFLLVGSSSLTCQQNGQWNAQLPRCEIVTTPPPITCHVLPTPSNGRVVNALAGVITPGQKMTFQCDGGHAISGSSERVCQVDGTWSGSDVRCIKVITCQDPGTPKNAIREVVRARSRIGGRGRGPGSGRRIVGTRLSRIGQSPRVGEETLTLPAGQLAVFTSVTYECESRFYSLIGSKSRTCGTTGQWSGRQPTCVPICGKSNGARTPNIINGELSRIGEYPWQAMLAHRQDSGEFFGVCGASLISEEWIITAAHCVNRPNTVDAIPVKDIKVYLGKYFRNNSLDDEFVQEFTIVEAAVHPKYDPGLLDSDLALLKLSRPVKLSERVTPICLPADSDTGVELSNTLLQSGSLVTVTGWGETENFTTADKLLVTRLATINNLQCENKYSQTNLPLVVTSNMFCAGHDDARSDTCFGDSGGPAVAFSGSGDSRKWYLLGIVSWGSPLACGVSMQYSGFTKVSKFLPFIYRFAGL